MVRINWIDCRKSFTQNSEHTLNVLLSSVTGVVHFDHLPIRHPLSTSELRFTHVYSVTCLIKNNYLPLNWHSRPPNRHHCTLMSYHAKTVSQISQLHFHYCTLMSLHAIRIGNHALLFSIHALLIVIHALLLGIHAQLFVIPALIIVIHAHYIGYQSIHITILAPILGHIAQTKLSTSEVLPNITEWLAYTAPDNRTTREILLIYWNSNVLQRTSGATRHLCSATCHNCLLMGSVAAATLHDFFKCILVYG